MINDLFNTKDATALAKTFPTDHYKTLQGCDGEKGYFYNARSLVHMGNNRVSFSNELSDSWLELTKDLLSKQYRESMSLLTGYDLTTIPFEANTYHYDHGAYLGPHIDLCEKLVVHVQYFNESWQSEQGGCLAILNSPDPNDIAFEVLPVVGNSVVFVRSNHSWHEVKRVNNIFNDSRRSLVVTFYKPGSISTMWPPKVTPSLHRHTNLIVNT